MPVAEAHRQLPEQGGEQIHDDQGIQKPVGGEHRRAQYGGELLQRGLGAPHGGHQEQHQGRPGQQGHQQLGQPPPEQGVEGGGLRLVQQQGAGEHEKQGHRRRSQGGDQIGEVPQGADGLTQGAGGGVEIHHPQHGQHPQQIAVQAAGGRGTHRPTAFRRSRDRGGAWTGSFR